MEKVKRLPRGCFEIQSDEYGLLKGRFCTWSLDLFCQRQQIGLQEMQKRLSTDITIAAAADFLLAALEYQAQKDGKEFKLTRLHACDIIDEIGGITGFNQMVLFAFMGPEAAKKNESEAVAESA